MSKGLGLYVENWVCKDCFFNFVFVEGRFWNLLRLMFGCIFLSLEGDGLQNSRRLFGDGCC